MIENIAAGTSIIEFIKKPLNNWLETFSPSQKSLRQDIKKIITESINELTFITKSKTKSAIGDIPPEMKVVFGNTLDIMQKDSINIDDLKEHDKKLTSHPLISFVYDQYQQNDSRMELINEAKVKFQSIKSLIDKQIKGYGSKENLYKNLIKEKNIAIEWIYKNKLELNQLIMEMIMTMFIPLEKEKLTLYIKEYSKKTPQHNQKMIDNMINLIDQCITKIIERISISE